ncbi:MAG: acetyl/propionyl-CoA carboxylase subunit alpha [Acidimicrobiaceae bacterium]|nr:acetyl/propionyl-CoA carboxylase subunit alpha [Acidimicrobiaceae bacterium]
MTWALTAPFDTVLIANRGEIAVRVARTLSELGISSVAVYTDADAGGVHRRAADRSVRIGSYLSVDDVIDAAVSAGAQAIHPGYGFLSENAALARACGDAGITFIGPPASAIEAMGDKIAAKATVAAAGVSTVPGSSGAGLTDTALADAAREVGFPVLLKPSAGGGGKGMRLVERDDELADAIASARREATNSFGDDTLLVERFVTNPRHIEIQVVADTHGNVVHLAERECSLQRRHQKIVEEAPSPLLTPETRAAMGQQAVDAARACGYVGAGTVEFIVSSDRPDEFFFMEMNTRLQVEHPVTEAIFGVDLVEWQVRVAAGEPLPEQQRDLTFDGHAVEVRVYAEDASRGFLPTGGEIVAYREPELEGVRVDSGVASGSVVGSDFDPMLAKVIAWGADRAEALQTLEGALADTVIAGVTTNIGFLRRLLALDEVRDGRLDTGLVERHLDQLADPAGPNAVTAVAAAAIAPFVERSGESDPWTALIGWRHGPDRSVRRELDVSGSDAGRVVLEVAPQSGGRWFVRGDSVGERTVEFAGPLGDRADIVVDGVRSTVTVDRHGDTWFATVGGDTWACVEVVHRGNDDGVAGAHGDGVVRSPMPGTVIAVPVEQGAAVTAGQTVAIVEAMKMEHALTTPIDGTVDAVHAASGDRVALDQPIVTIVPDEIDD